MTDGPTRKSKVNIYRTEMSMTSQNVDDVTQTNYFTSLHPADHHPYSSNNNALNCGYIFKHIFFRTEPFADISLKMFLTQKSRGHYEAETQMMIGLSPGSRIGDHADSIRHSQGRNVIVCLKQIQFK